MVNPARFIPILLEFRANLGQKRNNAPETRQHQLGITTIQFQMIEDFPSHLSCDLLVNYDVYSRLSPLGTAYLPTMRLGEAFILARAVDRTSPEFKEPQNEHHEIYGAGTSFIVSHAPRLSLGSIMSDFRSDTVPHMTGSPGFG